MRWTLLPFVVLAVLTVLAPLAACGDRTPTAACDRFVACVEARDASRGTTTNLDRFRDGGACWTAAEEGAVACERSCELGLDVLARLQALPEECAP